MSVAFPITVCPPAAAYSMLPSEPQFVKPQQPISAKFEAHSEAVATGIGYDSYKFMQSLPAHRTSKWRVGIPAFVFDPTMLREVIVRAVECRAYGNVMKNINRRGTPKARLRRAEAQLMTKREGKIRTLDNLCTRYIDAKCVGDPNAKVLEAQIENLDTQLRLLCQPAATIASVLFLSYRVGLDSVGVGAELGLKAPHVRQIIFRCCRIAKQIENEKKASTPKK